MRTTVWLLLLCGLISLNVSAADSEFKEGVNYKVTPRPEKLPDPNKIEVLEFFWYGCPHCYDFESHIQPWLAHKPEGVSFTRIPHDLGREAGETHALAYHIAEKLGIVKRIHAPMFKAIHDLKQPMDRLNDVCDLFAKQGGITDEQCHAAADDEDVKHARNHDDFLIRHYEIANVPALVVDGRYYTDAIMAGGMSNLVKVLDVLIAKQKAARNIQTTLPDEAPPAAPPPKVRAATPSPF